MSTIDQLMDSLFFQRLVAERGLTTPGQVAELARSVMGDPSLDVEGAFQRGDVTAQTDPAEFTRKVQRPVAGEGRPERAAAGTGSDLPAGVSPDAYKGVSEWANVVVNEKDFEKADRLAEALNQKYGGNQVPTIQSIVQGAADSLTPGEPITAEGVAKAVYDKTAAYLDDLTKSGPGFSSAQKTAVQGALSVLGAVSKTNPLGMIASTLAGIAIDYGNLAQRNKVAEYYGQPTKELSPVSAFLGNLFAPVSTLFGYETPRTDLPGFVTPASIAGFTNDPEMTDIALSGVGINANPRAAITQQTYSAPSGSALKESYPLEYTASQLVGLGLPPGQLAQFGLTPEQITDVAIRSGRNDLTGYFSPGISYLTGDFGGPTEGFSVGVDPSLGDFGGLSSW